MQEGYSLINDAPFMAFLVALATLIAATLGIGIGYYVVNKQSKKYMRKAFGWPGFCLFGCIGTIVHELSHLLVSLLFFHVPTKVQLFRPVLGQVDGILGMVEHSYKPTRYRKAGNFFIGCAPMMAGAWITVILLRFVNIDMFAIIDLLKEKQWQQVLEVIKGVPIITESGFSWNVAAILFVVFSILINMDMSKKDYQSSMMGSVPLIIFAVITYWSMRVFNHNDIASKFADFVAVHIIVLLSGLLLCTAVMVFNFGISRVVKVVKGILRH